MIEKKQFRILFKHSNGVIDIDYIYAENEHEALDLPLDVEEYEEIEKISVELVQK